MNRLENALRDALRREDPPAGFTERVMKRVAERTATPAPGRRIRFIFPVWRLAAAAAFCALVVTSLGLQYRARAEARRELAGRQFVLAMRITSAKLEFVRQQLRGAAARESVPLPPGARLLPVSKEKK